MDEVLYLTESGVKKLQQKITEYQRRHDVLLEDLKLSREFGDLTENGEYISVRQELERVEARMAELQHILDHASVVTKTSPHRVVQFGSAVILKLRGGDKRSFRVVSTFEADPLNGLISDQSPFGKALLGKTRGEEIVIKTGSSTIVYTIVSIQ